MSDSLVATRAVQTGQVIRDFTVRLQKTLDWDVPNLGSRIKAARDADPRPVWKIAAEAEMSAQNWYRIEKEEQVLPYKTLLRIEAVLGVNFGVVVPTED